MSMNTPKTTPPRRDPDDTDREPRPMRPLTSKDLAQGLVHILAGKAQIERGLSVVQNRATREGLNRTVKDAVSNILDDIRAREL